MTEIPEGWDMPATEWDEPAAPRKNPQLRIWEVAYINSQLTHPSTVIKYGGIRLAFKHGWMVDDIAEKTGWPVGAVRDAIFGRPINLTGEARTDE